MEGDKPKSKAMGYVFLLITFFCWGSVFIFNKYAFEVFGSFTVTGFAYILALIGTFVIMKATKKQVKVKKEDVKYFVFLGLLGYWFSVSMTMVSNMFLSGSLASIINVTIQLVIPLFGIWLLKEKPSATMVVALVIGFIGAALIIVTSALEGSVIGVVCAILGVISWSYFSVMIRKLSYYPAEQIASYGYAIALVPALIMAVIEMNVPGWITYTPVNWADVGPINIFGVVWQGLFASTLASGLFWPKSLQSLPAATAASFYPLSPLISIVLGALLLHEVITVHMIVGAVLICVGIVMAVRSKVTVDGEEI